MQAIGGDGLARATRRPRRQATLVAAGAGAAARPGRALWSLLVACAACAALLGLGVTAARAELMFSTGFGSKGTGDGELINPQGIGVDQTTLGATSGDVYVADTGNARVEQFDSAGDFIRTWGWGVADGASSFEVCTSACRAGLPGAGAGQLSDPMSIAVDSSSGPSQGDVYVGDSGDKVVDKFSPSGSLLATIRGPSAGKLFTAISGVAVDANGNLWVADESSGTVYELNSSGTLLTEFNDTYGDTLAIAVDTSENVYLMRGSGETEKWSAAARAGTASPVKIDGHITSSRGLAVDLSTNDLYVGLNTSIDEWGANGKQLGNFGSGGLTQVAQLAYNPNITLPGAAGPGALYATDQYGDDVAVFVPPAPAAPAVLPSSESATGVTDKVATLNADVSASGLDTHVFFEYGPTTAYGTSTPAPPGLDIGSNFEAVTANLSGLSAGTTYHFRVVAANALGTTDGPDVTFTTATPTAPTVSGETAVSVTPTKATLEVAINPQFADTHYIFEYGPTAAYGTQVPLPPGTDIGEADTEQDATASLTGLQPRTTYHFRVVATNSIGTTDGQDETFTTTTSVKVDSMFVTGVTATAANLGAKIDTEGIAAHYRFEYGTTTSYGTDVPVPDGAIGAAEGDQGVAVHVEGLQPSTKYYFRVVATDSFLTETTGAQSFTTYAAAEPTTLVDGRAYELVSPTGKDGGDVGGGAVGDFIPASQSAWARAAASGSAIVYSSFSSFGDAQSAGVLTQYLSSRGPSGWTTHAISPPVTVHTQASIRPGYHFFTPDLTEGVLSWRGAPLAPGAPELLEAEDLYVGQLSTGQLEAVTNVAPPNGVSGYEANFEGASSDLRRVVFDANDALAAGGRANGSNVYEWVGGSLRLVSVLPGPGGVAAESALAGNGENEEGIPENVVSTDGSRIFWTDDSNDKQLYVREDGTRTVKLNESQRTPSLGDGHASFMWATPDGSRVFFVDATQLTNAPNDNGGLYEYEFASGKLRDLSTDSSGSPEVEGVVAASEDGESVYFVARASLAGAATVGGYNLYLSRDGVIRLIGTLSSEDNKDWNPSPEKRSALVTPDGEHLVLVSQAPLTGYDNIDANSGSPDAEVFLYDAGSDRLSCVSCNPSGAQPVGPASEPSGERTGHIPRFISEDGRRVFFDSKDVLLPADTNGHQNVYEYENGAVHLISSGTSEGISTFADASPDGDDLFFTTRAQLVPEDTDSSADMYDARVGGGFPAPASSSPPCNGESCRGPLSAPPAALGIDTEADGPAPEVLPAQPQVAQAPTTSPHKPKKRVRRKAKPKRSDRKSKNSRAGHHRRKGARQKRRRGGHTS